MSFPTYVTVPFDRTMTLASSSGPSMIRMLQDHLHRDVHRRCGRRRPLHHPAALVLAFGFEIEHALRLQLLEGQVPELQVQNFALARQQVVFNAESQHRFQVPPQDCRRNQLADRSDVISTALNLVQRIEPYLLSRLLFRIVRFIPLRYARVEIPAVIIDALALIGEPRHQRLHVTQRKALEMHQADDNIRYLHAGVVDVILDIDLLPRRPQQPYKRVAQDRIAQVPYMRGLVGIDARVLDQ